MAVAVKWNGGLNWIWIGRLNPRATRDYNVSCNGTDEGDQ